ncbi:unnamed protein product [Kluyveromyces dobzhanskii CBS 2104]|nr:unnamed protein product [Kluyveromyces dobzhanskii CBS 2104]
MVPNFERLVSTAVISHSKEEDYDYSLSANAIDPASLGVDTVNQWSGYLDYQDEKHWFYWFFESRNDPANDPVILVLNGGPGCSSLLTLFMEVGPASIGADLKPIHNPYSWNSNASVIFLDQPVNVGFSYSDERVNSTDDAAKDVYMFLDLFFTKFVNFTSNDFHVAGESYAGHYIPKLAHEIVYVHKNDAKFKLSSVIIGNGLTDPSVQFESFAPMACGGGGFPAILNETMCDSMAVDSQTCKKLTSACSKTDSTEDCIAASTFCGESLIDVIKYTDLNPFDLRGPCEDAHSGFCWKGWEYIDSYLNQRSIQEALGSRASSFVGCSSSVAVDFFKTGDNSKSFQRYVAELLDSNIPVLLFAGDTDFICNWLGNKAWSDALEWTGHEAYEKLPLKPWLSKDGSTQFGEVKNYGPLTFARVYEAGHLVPYYQPEASFEMIISWISKDISLSH